MDLITSEDIQLLLNEHPFPCISLFMPAIQTGETNQNHIRFKNLLKEVEDKLSKQGIRSSEIQNYIRPANELVNDPLFWQSQSRGLAVFLAPDLFRSYRLPQVFNQQVDIGNRFIVHPLLQLLEVNQKFYILALSQDDSRLLEGDRYQIKEVPLEKMPTSLAQAMIGNQDHHQTDWEYRKAATGSSQAAGSYHGQGVVKNEHLAEMQRYFRKIDQALLDYLGEQRSPLIIAGVEELLPLYRETSEYRYLTRDAITGNPDGIKDKDLHQRAWEIVAPRFEKDRETAADLFRQWARTSRASSKPEEIVPAAFYGRNEFLFVPQDIQVYGSFDPMTGDTHIHQEKSEKDLNLADLAASYTFINNGHVYVVGPNQSPVNGSLAAVFRYEM